MNRLAALSQKLWLVLLVALALRLAFVLLIFPALDARLGGAYAARGIDSDNYLVIANSFFVAKYTDVERAPLYPAFLAAILALFYHSTVAVQVAQAILDSSTVALLWLIGRRIAPDRSIAAWACWLYAFYPLAWWRCVFINKEILQTFTVALFVLSFLSVISKSFDYKCLDSTSPKRPSPLTLLLSCFLCGVMLGVVNLVKPIFLLLPLVLAIWVWRGRKRILHAPVVIGTLLVGMLVVIAPWTIRNHRVANAFVPVATERGGITMFIGNYYPSRGMWEGEHKYLWQNEVDRIAKEHAGANPIEMDRIYFRATLANIASHPLQFAELFIRKAWRFWFTNASERLRWLVLLVQLTFLGLAVAGLFKRGFDAVAALFFFLLVGYVWLLHAAIYADARFSLPLMPYVMLFAAVTLTRKDANVEKTV